MNGSLPAAVLWDMDGTIIDTEPMWIIAERKMLEEWGSELTETDAKAWVGIGLWELANIFQERGVALDTNIIVHTLTNEVSEQLFAGEVQWRPGARELLASLGEHGIQCALVTMAPRGQAQQVVSQLPAGTFQTLTAGDDVARPKPHPDPYLQGAQSLGVNAKDCVAIEDSLIGTQSAFASGAVVLGVPNMLDLSETTCHTLIPSLSDIDAAGIVEMFREHRAQPPPHVKECS